MKLDDVTSMYIYLCFAVEITKALLLLMYCLYACSACAYLAECNIALQSFLC